MKKDQTKIISRRDFLKLAGLTAGGVAAGQFVFSEVMAVPQKVLDKVARSTGKETWINTVCRQCPGGCGIRVRRIDGIPVYIRGNPIFPVNRGGVCPMAHTSTEVLFNPDRIRTPLKQTGTKGQDEWEETDWNQALESITQRLRSLVSRGEGHRIALINGDNSPLMRRLSQYWMQAVGSPNYYEDDKLRDNTVAAQLSQGLKETPAYDLANSKLILNFGSNFLQEGISPVYYQQLFGHLKSAHEGAVATFVHIDSRIGLTGSNFDRWIPIRPGTHGALALGIAYVLIASKLYHEDFVQEHTSGFNPFRDHEGREHMGFRSFVRANYYPEKVSGITGVPAETIIKLAQQFGTRSPAVAISDDASRYATNGSFTQWAVYCLNALVGNIQKKGGIYFTPPTPEFRLPQLSLDSKTRTSLSQPKVGSEVAPPTPLGDISVDQFAEALVSGEGDKIDTLIIIDANPVFHSRKREAVIQALHTINHVVFSGIIMDETARHCDLILPDHSYLEKIDVSGPIPGLIFGHVGLQQPVIRPLFNTKQSGDVLMEVGKSVLGPDAFPLKSYKDLVLQRLKAIYQSGSGSIISQSSDAEWIRYLKERGWKLQQYETFKSFQKLIVKNGGWWNPADPTRSTKDIFRNETKKFEFYSSTLRKLLEEKSLHLEGTSPREKRDRLLSRLHISARGDDLLLPHYEPPFSVARAEEFPLLLTVSQLLTNRDGRGASQPSMMEIVGIQVGRYWTSWIEINPETGREYGLRDRKLAWVESSKGRVLAGVRYFQGIRPGIVHIHLGLGHTSYGRFGTGVGVNASDLIENTQDSLVNIPALNGTRVKVGPVLRGV